VVNDTPNRETTMTISELKKMCEELEAKGLGNSKLYTTDGSEYTPVAAGSLYEVEGMPVVAIDLTIGDDE
jgi:hypothetical protein